MADKAAAAQAELEQREPFDSADRDSVNKRNSKLGRERRERLEVLRNIMSTPRGRMWMFDILQYCRIFQPSYVLGDSTTDAIFREGARQVGLKIYGDIVYVCPEDYVRMVSENQAEA